MVTADPHVFIKQKQMRMSAKYAEKKPSRVKQISWIYALRRSPYPADTPRSGKYLAFVSPADADACWALIKDATHRGLFDDASKVSTKAQRRRKHDAECVICIYTYDCEDMDDRRRIERNLEQLGFRDLRYKTNHATMQHY